MNDFSFSLQTLPCPWSRCSGWPCSATRPLRTPPWTWLVRAAPPPHHVFCAERLQRVFQWRRGMSVCLVGKYWLPGGWGLKWRLIFARVLRAIRPQRFQQRTARPAEAWTSFTAVEVCTFTAGFLRFSHDTFTNSNEKKVKLLLGSAFSVLCRLHTQQDRERESETEREEESELIKVCSSVMENLLYCVKW